MSRDDTATVKHCLILSNSNKTGLVNVAVGLFSGIIDRQVIRVV